MFYKPKIIEFFAGSGLVRQGLGLWYETVWANDICDKKAKIYRANFGNKDLHVKPIEEIKGREIPAADLAWASFPCQDLSLAGNLAGIHAGARSGLFWEWLRVLDEMSDEARPKVLAVENVVGWLVSNGGSNFSDAYYALKNRGYLLGALVVDAIHFVPQSRPRAFIVAVKNDVELAGLKLDKPDDTFHPKSVRSAAASVSDKDWIWWRLPRPPIRNSSFTDLCDFDATQDHSSVTERLMSMLSPINRTKLEKAISSKGRMAGTGYKRTRRNSASDKIQRLEIRFDGVAGCLRTPEGGSSRQTVLIAENGSVKTRLMTVRETARLMGAPEEFKIPGTYYDGYKAMGDAVCAPVAGWLAEHLLSPLSIREKDTFVVAAE